MSLTDIKTKSQGFTIVELLIVVVVIAILAAITIVSYNGITNRANASAAKSTAATWQKKIELYQAENGRYPINVGEMSADTDDAWYITNASLTPDGAAPNASTGKSRVQVVACGDATPTDANVTGARVTYHNYEGSGSVNVIVGTCATPGTNGATAWDGPDA